MDGTALRAREGEAARDSLEPRGGRAGWEQVLENGYRVALCLTADADSAGRLLETCLRGLREEIREEPVDGPPRLPLLRRLVALYAAESRSAETDAAPDRPGLDSAAALAVTAVRLLEGEVRVATALHCGGGCAPGEVAAVLGTPREIAQQRLRRGRRLLRGGLHDPSHAHPVLVHTGTAAR
jgi:hypothetical protein